MSNTPGRENQTGSINDPFAEVGESAAAPDSAAVDHRAEIAKHAHRPRWGLHIGLFAATCVSVFIAGLIPGRLGIGNFDALYAIVTDTPLVENAPPQFRPAALLMNGIVFSVCLMGTLLAHEFGHFIVAKIHRVWATLPFFIPFPFSPFGTMGAVIVQGRHDADRRQLFDIAIAGPLAGLVLALPIAWYGISISSIEQYPDGQPPGPRWGDPLVMQGMVTMIHRPYDTSVEDIQINAALFAGWVGIFITALNLMPLGQLDGGHILYTLIGKWQHRIAGLLMLAAFAANTALAFA